MTLTDAELIKGCKRGDREAQHELYVRSSEKIYRLLVRMTRNPDAAFDLAQEAYLRAFSRIGQFNGESSLTTWLYRIAVNEALQFLRRKDRLRLIGEFDPADCPSSSTMDQAVAALDIDGALNRLDPADRAVLLLRYQEGLDYGAIAAVMECPAGTVASRLNRARRRVQELLAAGYGPVEEKEPGMHPIKRGTVEEIARVPENLPRAETGFP